MEELPPHIDENGKVWFHLRLALSHIGPAITYAALRAWAANKRTPWGLSLEVRSIPTLKTGRRHNPEAHHLDLRLLISEESTRDLATVLRNFERGASARRFTKDDISDLETRTRLLLRGSRKLGALDHF
jgi:hypothetical protein